MTPLAFPMDWIKCNFVYLQVEVKINAVVLLSRDTTKLSIHALVSVLVRLGTNQKTLLEACAGVH